MIVFMPIGEVDVYTHVHMFLHYVHSTNHICQQSCLVLPLYGFLTLRHIAFFKLILDKIWKFHELIV